MISVNLDLLILKSKDGQCRIAIEDIIEILNKLSASALLGQLHDQHPKELIQVLRDALSAFKLLPEKIEIKQWFRSRV